ncbi:DUF3810 domain-containing protein [Flavisolibacter nicotianae]|uniref:DUF3810 domain-containing protein n=1 Tax=Flavisolibacter nicotianae TaxID=2364882 RepID=UPI000EAF7756|nr:DUF3810 domain-containing protein [Flavisolibacter nicotianae]
MFKALFRDRYLILLLLVAVLLRLFALDQSGVERIYTVGVYPVLSRIFRAVFGWVPFSVGDVVYFLAFAWLVWKTWKLVLVLKHRRGSNLLSWELFRKYLKLSLLVYIVFMSLWGMNYYRQGLPAQLGLKVEHYSVQDLFDVTMVLQQRLNSFAEKVDSVQRLTFNQNDFLFRRGEEAYQTAQRQYPFLAYRQPSLKPSLYTPVGHWFGFTGYYNPFTAEAQLRTTIPVFLKPFVISHEMAHQLGYAKENEASFVAYLTCKASADVNFLYSAYFELYRDAIFECRLTPNKEITEPLRRNIHPRVRIDAHDLQLYLLRNKNFVEPFMSGFYDRYLKFNNQPKGTATYDEVIAYLIAYMKKYGKDAI